MNEVYRTPLFTFWPMPVDLRECFSFKKKSLKNKVKSEIKRILGVDNSFLKSVQYTNGRKEIYRD